jgi:hypothetical protein
VVDDAGSTTLEEAVYGGPTDLWGLPTLTAADVLDEVFGVGVAATNGGTGGTPDASIDFASIYVFTDEGFDCDDDDPALFLARTAYTDADNDNAGGALDGAQCLGAPRLPAGLADRPSDCADDDSRARPGATTYYDTPRPDGSFDFNCSGTETWPAITSATGCSFDAATNVCTTTYVNIVEAPCGESQTVGVCDGTCALVSQAKTTLCR